MRIALVPLDSRPPSWQFPLRIAQIAGDELLSPPRELLGTLHKSADQHALLEWLTTEAARSGAAVISWDALVYGGLVQSRAEGDPLNVRELTAALSSIDWQRCKGYLWLTVPRLGMTITSQQDWELHKQIAEYFRVWGESSANPGNAKAAAQLKELEAQIGAETIAHAWWLRRRNADYARDALQLAATLGFRTCHVACEDNARTGPHLDEVAELRKFALELSTQCRRDSREPPRFTFFDGTDECGSLLTARAILDERNAPPLPVRLTLFPSSPTPDKYFGLYESHSLEDGLLFLAKFLGFEFRAEGKVQWLVCFGKQPQPDIFAEDPVKITDQQSNTFLLPSTLEGDEPLFLADLQFCNGGNSFLIQKVFQYASNRLHGLSAWNTNFNALATSAATIAAAACESAGQSPAFLFLHERLIDDYFYQGTIRGFRTKRLRKQHLNPLDLASLPKCDIERMELSLSDEVKRSFPELVGAPPAKLGGRDMYDYGYSLRLPWQRMFEIEVSFG